MAKKFVRIANVVNVVADVAVRDQASALALDLFRMWSNVNLPDLESCSPSFECGSESGLEDSPLGSASSGAGVGKADVLSWSQFLMEYFKAQRQKLGDQLRDVTSIAPFCGLIAEASTYEDGGRNFYILPFDLRPP